MSQQERRGDWMQTYSKKKFYILDPREEDIDIRDIAHHLSLQCRFTGACNTFYSVAQHSVLVSKHVSPQAALYGLMHDAEEAYIGDISRPFKESLKQDRYRDVYDALQWIASQIKQCIRNKFSINVSTDIRDEVKKVDTLMLVTEARDLMCPLVGDWYSHASHGFATLPEQIEPLSPMTAEVQFLERFYQLTHTEDIDREHYLDTIGG